MELIKKYRSFLSSNVIKEIAGLGTFKNDDDSDDEDEKGNKII